MSKIIHKRMTSYKRPKPEMLIKDQDLFTNFDLYKEINREENYSAENHLATALNLINHLYGTRVLINKIGDIDGVIQALEQDLDSIKHHILIAWDKYPSEQICKHEITSYSLNDHLSYCMNCNEQVIRNKKFDDKEKEE